MMDGRARLDARHAAARATTRVTLGAARPASGRQRDRRRCGCSKSSSARATFAVADVRDLAALDATSSGPRGWNYCAWRGRTVLIDGAHNPAGARALASYLRETYGRRLPMVVGVMRDKNDRRIARGAGAGGLARSSCTAASSRRARPRPPSCRARAATRRAGTSPCRSTQPRRPPRRSRSRRARRSDRRRRIALSGRRSARESRGTLVDDRRLSPDASTDSSRSALLLACRRCCSPSAADAQGAAALDCKNCSACTRTIRAARRRSTRPSPASDAAFKTTSPATSRIDCDDTQIFADEIEWRDDEQTVTLTGHVAVRAARRADHRGPRASSTAKTQARHVLPGVGLQRRCRRKPGRAEPVRRHGARHAFSGAKSSRRSATARTS